MKKKLLIVCALFFEAKPFINSFRLLPLPSSSSFQTFGNEEIVLIITGTNKIASSAGTTYLLTKYPDASACVNIGICGSNNQSIGDILIIDHIIDHDTGRTYYPDILIQNNFKRSGILSICKPESKQRFHLPIDMEASGFFEAASNFLNADSIHIIKIVSDDASKTLLSPDSVKNIIKKAAAKIIPYIKKNQNLSTVSISKQFQRQEINCIQNLIKKYHFTLTQERKLHDLLWNLKIQTGKNIDTLLNAIHIEGSTEKEKTKKFLIALEKKLKQY